MWWTYYTGLTLQWWASPSTLAAIALTYFAIVRVCRGRRVPGAAGVAALQLLALALGSAALVGLIVWELLPEFASKHWLSLLCDEDQYLWQVGTIGRLQALNYALKVLEMSHSPMLALSGRNVSGMHQWHHVCMLAVSWSQLGPSGCSVQWLPILLNAASHVYMYACLLAVFVGSKRNWGALLPRLQVFQVLITGAMLLLVMGIRALHDLYDPFSFPKCAGTWSSAFFASALVMTYPLAYLSLHRPCADGEDWLGERGIGLFMWIWGANVRRDEEKLRHSRSQKDLHKLQKGE